MLLWPLHPASLFRPCLALLLAAWLRVCLVPPSFVRPCVQALQSPAVRFPHGSPLTSCCVVILCALFCVSWPRCFLAPMLGYWSSLFVLCPYLLCSAPRRLAALAPYPLFFARFAPFPRPSAGPPLSALINLGGFAGRPFSFTAPPRSLLVLNLRFGRSPSRLGCGLYEWFSSVYVFLLAL